MSGWFGKQLSESNLAHPPPLPLQIVGRNSLWFNQGGLQAWGVTLFVELGVMNDHHMIEWQEKGGGGICKWEGGWGAKGAKGELLTLTGKARAPSNEWPQEWQAQQGWPREGEGGSEKVWIAREGVNLLCKLGYLKGEQIRKVWDKKIKISDSRFRRHTKKEGIQYQNQSKGLVADEESSRVLFCEQRIFAAIFPRHCSQTWGETLYFYCICETVYFYCICDAVYFYCICVVRLTWNDLYYIGPLSLKKDFCLNVYKWNLGHKRSFVCLIQCKLFELRSKSSFCVRGALYLWTSFLDQNGICTRTHKVFGDWWSQVHRLVWEHTHRLGLARLGNQTCGQAGWKRKQM